MGDEDRRAAQLVVFGECGHPLALEHGAIIPPNVSVRFSRARHRGSPSCDGGTRWIIDYKTGTHTGSDLDRFLENEQARYRAQLEGYASVIQTLDARPIRLGLYFPMLQGWREWPFVDQSV